MFTPSQGCYIVFTQYNGGWDRSAGNSTGTITRHCEIEKRLLKYGGASTMEIKHHPFLIFVARENPRPGFKTGGARS